MKVLIACEESQTVCKEFRKKGHEAYSCDIVDCSGGHPEWHIKNDCIPLLNGYCCFCTEDGKSHTILGKWDLIIAHPPCTYLTVTGNRWFNVERYGDKALERYKLRADAAEFFMKIAKADCDKIAIENPVGFMSTYWRKPDQTIHPYYFGDPFEKRTCLWLKNLPLLEKTNEVEPPARTYFPSGSSMATWYAYIPNDQRSRVRSKTFPGFAKACAEQWGG